MPCFFDSLTLAQNDAKNGSPREAKPPSSANRPLSFFCASRKPEGSLLHANAFKNAKRQLDAIKGAASIVKGAVNGTMDEAQAAEAAGAVGAYFEGDRTEWIKKADAALAPYNK